VPIKEEMDWVQLDGFVAKPEGAKKVRGEQFLFVNGRFFKSPYLNKAVQEAFDGLLLPGYVPSFFLFLDLNPEKIDVNIHPQKTEVKFEDEHLIFALLRSTIKKSLGIYNIAPSLDFDRDTKMDEFFGKVSPSSQNKLSIKAPEISVDRDFNPFQSELGTTRTEIQNLAEIYHHQIDAAPSKINLFEDEDFDEDLMRLPNGYWLFNKGNVTLMLDLGRMHRLLVSQNNNSITQNNTSHALLFSLEYHLNEIEKNKYRSIKKYLPQLGYEMQIANENVLRINAVPEGLKETQVMKFLETLFEILDYKTEEEFMYFYQNKWNKMQSKSRFDFIYKNDAEQLIKEFTQLGFPEFLPDGKRCFIEIPFDDYKNKF
jgi:DNA mismatch repair protein MutL